MFQPLRTSVFVVVVQPHVDEVAAAADPLQDVLDVVAEHGDGLPHRGQRSASTSACW
jgi:hypothetical protein